MFLCGVFYFYNNFRVYLCAYHDAITRLKISFHSIAFQTKVKCQHKHPCVTIRLRWLFHRRTLFMKCSTCSQCNEKQFCTNTFSTIEWIALMCVSFWYRKRFSTINESNVRVFNFLTKPASVENKSALDSVNAPVVCT